MVLPEKDELRSRPNEIYWDQDKMIQTNLWSRQIFMIEQNQDEQNQDELTN